MEREEERREGGKEKEGKVIGGRERNGGKKKHKSLNTAYENVLQLCQCELYKS